MIENQIKVKPVSAQLLEVLDDTGGKQAVGKPVQQWAGLAKLKTRYQKYLQQNTPVIPNACEKSSISAINKAQKQLRKELEVVKVNLPPVNLLNQFNALVSPMVKQKLTLTRANRNLIQTRDLLFSPLISGKLSVENLDIHFPSDMKEPTQET